MVIKIVADLDEIDLDQFIKLCNSEHLEFCCVDECLYVHGGVNTQKSIVNILGKMKIKNYFSKIIKKPQNYQDCESNIGLQWCYEKCIIDETEQINAQKQKEIKQMLDNIEAVRSSLSKKLQGGEKT